MKSFFTLTTALLATTLFMAAPKDAEAQDGKWTREQLQDMYLEFLMGEGYRPELDKDGDVIFKSEGLNYFIKVNENDLEYFSLNLIFSLDITTDLQRREAYSAANVATSTTKVSKVNILSDEVVLFSTEIFLESPEQFKGIFSRCISALRGCKTKFFDEFKTAKN